MELRRPAVRRLFGGGDKVDAGDGEGRPLLGVSETDFCIGIISIDCGRDLPPDDVV